MQKPDIAINNAFIVNENQIKTGTILISGQRISEIIYNKQTSINGLKLSIDAKGKYLIPGVIDDQVHFREPGLTHKGDIYSESRAAVAGGVTSYMEMPNTIPQTTTNILLEEKFKIASSKSLANYSFYIGATNNNLKELISIDKRSTCGIKIFMGSSTGNMLVNDISVLESIFKSCKCLIATHCEDDTLINKNFTHYYNIYGSDITVEFHPKIRNSTVCFNSSSLAVKIAKKHETKLHVLHLSSKKELQLFDSTLKLSDKRITAEVCVNHLLFDNSDYKTKSNLIKCNPAIKSKIDKEALMDAVNSDIIDIIATDHAPHTLSEKKNVYTKSPSGGPFVQHSLAVMLDFYKEGKINLEKIVEKMCHNPAILYNVENRGFLRKNYWADMVLLDLDNKWTVEKNNIFYKCGWSPIEGSTLKTKILQTFVNGNLVYDNGIFNETIKGMALVFNR
ncbi:MAG: dihydroorotase [Bacteroidota bacterium]